MKERRGKLGGIMGVKYVERKDVDLREEDVK